MTNKPVTPPSKLVQLAMLIAAGSLALFAEIGIMRLAILALAGHTTAGNVSGYSLATLAALLPIVAVYYVIRRIRREPAALGHDAVKDPSDKT